MFGTENHHICPFRYCLGLCIKKFTKTAVISVLWFPLGVSLSLSHTIIGVPWGFHPSFPASIPVTFIFDPPSRALNTTEGPFIILEDFESSPFTVPLKKVRGKVDSELKILQKRSKYHFRGKGRQCIIGKAIQHLCRIDPYISLRINNWF